MCGGNESKSAAWPLVGRRCHCFKYPVIEIPRPLIIVVNTSEKEKRRDIRKKKAGISPLLLPRGGGGLLRSSSELTQSFFAIVVIISFPSTLPSQPSLTIVVVVFPLHYQFRTLSLQYRAAVLSNHYFTAVFLSLLLSHQYTITILRLLRFPCHCEINTLTLSYNLFLSILQLC